MNSSTEQTHIWNTPPFDEWTIYRINHYYTNGKKQISVVLQKKGRFIRENGTDDKYLWNRLWHKATK